MFTWGGFDIVGAEKEKMKIPLSKAPRGFSPNIPNSEIAFTLKPQFSGDPTFYAHATIVSGRQTSVDTPSGNYFVKNIVPNGFGGAPGFGNPGVSVTVSGR